MQIRLKSNLHEDWLAYREGEFDEKGLVERVYRYVMANPKRFYLMALSKDERHELFADFFNRFLKAGRRYKEDKGNFDAYIHSMLHWVLLESWRKRERFQQVENMVWEVRAFEEACEATSFYNASFNNIEQIAYPSIGSARQRLFLILKVAPLISKESVPLLARGVDMPAETLFALLDQVKTISFGEERRLSYRSKIEYYSARILTLKGILEKKGHTPKNRELYTYQLRRTEEKKERLQEIQGRNILTVQNRIIAQVLGVSASTVSASLRLLREEAFACNLMQPSDFARVK